MGLAMTASERTLRSIINAGVFVAHSHGHYTLLRLDGRRWLYQNSLEATSFYIEDGAIDKIVADRG
jgi:hypothetical protein